MGLRGRLDEGRRVPKPNTRIPKPFVGLYCNFRSLAFLGLLGFLIRQLQIKFIATLLSAAKNRGSYRIGFTAFRHRNLREVQGLGFRV